MNQPHIIRMQHIPDETPVSVWEKLLDRQSSYSYFQTPQWSRMLVDSFPEYESSPLHIEFDDGVECVLPCMVIPKKMGFKKIESMLWNTYGSPVGEHIGAAHINAIANSLLKWNQPVFQMTLHPSFYGRINDNDLKPYRNEHQSTHILHLNQPYEDIEKQRFQSRLRTTIRKSEHEGVTIRWSNDRDAVEAFTNLYIQACERWGEALAVPPVFFNRLVDQPEGVIRIWFAEYQGKAIAADIMLYGKLEVQYFTGAMASETAHLNASKLLMSRVIQDACERNYGLVNFGSSAGLKGVEQFKERFGGVKSYYARLGYRHFIFRVF